MRSKHKKTFTQLTCTILSLIAVAAINYTIIHNSFIFIILLVLLAHEMGHYLAAKKTQAEPSLPIFIPLPFIFLAATRIKNVTPKNAKQIAIAGPIAGALTALLFLLFATIYKTVLLPVKYLLILLIQEIVTNYFGSDGKKYRNAPTM